MKFSYFYIIVITLLVVSCKDQLKEDYLMKIEGLEKTLDSLEMVSDFPANQFNPEQEEEMKENINFIINRLENDTLDYDFVQIFDSYKGISKAFSVNSGNLVKAKQAIPEVKKNIEKLKHDIKKGVNKREKYQEYINFEETKINNISEILEYYLDTKHKYESILDSLQPIIVSFGESMLEKTDE